jgi:hypothetical protein
MQFVFAGIVLIVGFPIAVHLLLAILSNPLILALTVPAGLYAISR